MYSITGSVVPSQTVGLYCSYYRDTWNIGGTLFPRIEAPSLYKYTQRDGVSLPGRSSSVSGHGGSSTVAG